MPDLIIREAEKQDAPAIILLVQELAQADAEKYPLDHRFVENYLGAAGCYVLVAEMDGSVAGMLSYSIRPNLYHAGSTCLIEELVVTASARGRGAGKALLESAIQRARQTGCLEISVTTMPDNQPAIEFYRRHGLTDEAVYLEMHFQH